jgi:coenzyme F420 hydrogenase subunit beta
MKKNNSPTINTKGLRIEELSKLNSVEFNQKEEDGITSRIKKIK